jgi:hypothetical protein
MANRPRYQSPDHAYDMRVARREYLLVFSQSVHVLLSSLQSQKLCMRDCDGTAAFTNARFSGIKRKERRKSVKQYYNAVL